MGTFREMLDEDLVEVFHDTEDGFADPATFTAAGGDPVSTTAILSLLDNLHEAHLGFSEMAQVRLPVKDVGSPSHGDLVVIGEQTWKVVRRIKQDAGEVILEVRKSERAVFK